MKKFLFALVMLASLVLNYGLCGLVSERDSKIVEMEKLVQSNSDQQAEVTACEDSMSKAFEQADLNKDALEEMSKAYIQCRVQLTICIEDKSDVTTHPVP